MCAGTSPARHPAARWSLHRTSEGRKAQQHIANAATGEVSIVAIGLAGAPPLPPPPRLPHRPPLPCSPPSRPLLYYRDVRANGSRAVILRGAILGIESSCDETSAAVVLRGEQTLSNVVASQIPTHSPPTAASFLNWLRANICATSFPWCARHSTRPAWMQQIDAIAVTEGPGLAGSLAGRHHLCQVSCPRPRQAPDCRQSSRGAHPRCTARATRTAPCRRQQWPWAAAPRCSPAGSVDPGAGPGGVGRPHASLPRSPGRFRAAE